MYTEITGNLITEAKKGNFDVIAHGCNIYCSMGAGIAPQMAQYFGADKYPLEMKPFMGDINKLGQIEWRWIDLETGEHRNKRSKNHTLAVVNCYTQENFGKNHEGGDAIPLDYEALTLCLRKMNHEFKGMKIGLPQIGCGLAGGDWTRVKQIIQEELTDVDVIVVIYDQPAITLDKFRAKSNKL